MVKNLQETDMGGAMDILVLPFFGHGHLFPCTELCKHLSSHNCKSLFIIPSHLSSSIPSDLHHHPSVELILIESSSSCPPRRHPLISDGDSTGPETKPVHHQLEQGIQTLLSGRFQKVRPACVVMDMMMSWSKDIFKKADIPIVSFFTSDACSTAMSYAAWKPHVDNIGPDPTRIISGLPESMALSYYDTKRWERQKNQQARGTGRRPGGPNRGPPILEPYARWLDRTEGSVAVLINTCDDLEALFLKYLTDQVEKPVLGVGPLLPETFWNSIGSVVRDKDSRPNKESNYAEDEVIEWLDSKPYRSVIYVSFGSQVGPSVEEYDQLAEALAETDKSFIWVIQSGAGRPGLPASIIMFGNNDTSDFVEEGYQPRVLEERVGNRGLIIKGWAPQLSILSHPSMGGFLSHCGWNSTVEAMGCGVPILAWPIGGDQFYNAMLVVKHLNTGHIIPGADQVLKVVKKVDIIECIEVLMNDGEVGDRAVALRGVFEAGYPSSFDASFKALVEQLHIYVMQCNN